MYADINRAILPDGVDLQEGSPPEAPTDFGKGYRPPTHSVKPLQQRLGEDKSLVFFEEEHIYTKNGVPCTTSVTTLAHEFERPFVADEAIRMMKHSRTTAWPRHQYVAGLKPLDEGDPVGRVGVLLVRGDKTVATLCKHSFTESSNVFQMLRDCAIQGNGDEESFFTFERGMTDDEIKEAWDVKRDLSSNLGTEAHYQAELFCNGLPYRLCDEVHILADFVKTCMVPRGLKAWDTEKEIHCGDADLAGSIDLIVYDPARKVHHIVDYKRSDKLKKDLRGYGKMLPPLQHLEDCKGASYALQLSIYQWILEREYGLTIGDRVLVSLHPDAPFYTSVPYMRAEVDLIMRRRMETVRARREVGMREGFRCELTGAPLVDAVVTDDEVHCMEKVAQLRGLKYRADEARRADFERSVASLTEEVSMAKEDCVTWRRRMPEGGIPPFPKNLSMNWRRLQENMQRQDAKVSASQDTYLLEW